MNPYFNCLIPEFLTFYLDMISFLVPCGPIKLAVVQANMVQVNIAGFDSIYHLFFRYIR